MTKPPISPNWVDGELRLSGIDSRMMVLLKAIDGTGSINQAAKYCGLSYKGAWQIIERANNSSPKILVNTATGGSKGGGTCLTSAGKALLELFQKMEVEHRQFLDGINRGLAKNPELCLLLQHLAVKTSVRNQLFSKISTIAPGAVNVQVSVELAGGGKVIASISQGSLDKLHLKEGGDVVLLMNGTDIALADSKGGFRFSAANCLPCRIVRIQEGDINAEVSLMLAGGEILTAVITRQSLLNMKLKKDDGVVAVFKANAPIMGVL